MLWDSDHDICSAVDFDVLHSRINSNNFIQQIHFQFRIGSLEQLTRYVELDMND